MKSLIHCMLVLWVSGAVLPPAAAQTADPARPWAAQADELLAKGELEKALAQYERLSREHADDVGIWLRISSVHLLAQRPGAALEAARTARSVDPEDPQPFAMLAQAHVGLGDLKTAFASLEEGLRQFPKDIELLEIFASLTIGTQQWAKASGTLRELSRLDPKNPVYRLDLVRILLSNLDLEGAKAELEAVKADHPDHPLVSALSGRTALLEGRLDEARRLFDRSLAVNETAEALGGIGAVHFLNGDAQGAARSFARAVELSPLDADLHFNLGNAFMQLGDVKSAELAYRNSLDLAPDAPDSHANLGILLLNMLKVNEARAHLERAVELDREAVGPHLHLARLYRASFDYDTAISHYQTYRDRTDDDAERTRIEGVLVAVRRAAEASSRARGEGKIHLLQMRVPTPEAATVVMERVRAGEDFYSLAEQASDLAEVTGVDAGFLHPGELSEQFRPYLQSLEVGSMTEAIATEAGVYVFMRVE